MLDFAVAFVLGFVVAGLLGFAMLPAVWARAQRLVRRRLEAQIPISMAEVRAGRDQIRAAAAMDQRRLEERVDREFTARHAVMAENGRQAAVIRRSEARYAEQEHRIVEAEEAASAARLSAAEAREHISTLKAEVASARVTLTLREEEAAEHRRGADALRAENDGRKIEIVALNTQLAGVVEQLRSREREIADQVVAARDREGQAALLAERQERIGRLEAEAAAQARQVEALDTRLSEALKDGTAFEVAQAELDRRLMGLAEELRRRDQALADRDGRLAFASGREKDLLDEVARLRQSSQRIAADLARAAPPDRGRGRAEPSVEALSAERLRLEGELAGLRRERDAWRTIEADNRKLRAEIVRVAAAIARQTAPTAPSLADLMPANDASARAKDVVHDVGAQDNRVDAPPV